MTKRVSVNSRCRTLTGKARGLMGCKQNTQMDADEESFSFLRYSACSAGKSGFSCVFAAFAPLR